ncbi:hypothetical protein JCGZ_00446 [Jatropha curcas]|uniref:BHLH domain-containing protein n=1 Tax=Jatropha curcas TaxID=180498 RepID=A0A067JTJ0_JATCU|nr:transcription factor bHLH140 [Jatropha curcas]KDP22859.1 hypothetical protein JCGZ_00446 [Jatropha curcas]
MEDYFYTTNPNYSSSASSSLPPNHNATEKKQKGSKRGNNGVKLSTDPQSVAARERRHRISDRFKILQSLVPGGSKMDTVSMLEEAINYVKFLKTQILLHQTIMNYMDDDLLLYLNNNPPCITSIPPQQQLPLNLDGNLVDAGLQPTNTSLLPLPDSFFHGQQTMRHHPFDKNY